MSRNLTVKDLAKELQKLVKEGKGDQMVVVSSDSEGNAFSPLSGISIDMLYFQDDNQVIGKDEKGIPEGGEDSIVIWPSD